jgi:hypothetical protein
LAQVQQQGNTDYILDENTVEIGKMKVNISKKIIHNLKKTIGDEDINFTGKLTDSIHRVKMDGVHMVLIDSPYAHIVNWGLAPGTFVNFDALRIWVEGKLGVPSDQSENVTWLIMKKIERQGIKPKFFVKKALKKLIGKHGVVSLKRVSVKKKGKWGRRLNKAKKNVNKALKKINKSIKKANRIAKKANKTASKSINTATKFYKALRKYK